jgi:hypothetical protein
MQIQLLHHLWKEVQPEILTITGLVQEELHQKITITNRYKETTLQVVLDKVPLEVLGPRRQLKILAREIRWMCNHHLKMSV